MDSQPETRVGRNLVVKEIAKAYDLEEREARDPVVVYTMGCLDAEAREVAQEQKSLLKSGSVKPDKAREALEKWVARQDGMFNLSKKQFDYLSELCHSIVGLKERRH